MSRPTKRMTAVLATLALVLGACGKNDERDGTEGKGGKAATTTATSPAASTGTETTKTTATTAQGCEDVPEPKPQPDGKRSKPGLRLDRDKVYEATLVTTCGTIEFALDSKNAPKTTASFVALARDGFFDNLIFHRIAMPNAFVIQSGDPTGSGNGGPGYSVTEAPPSDTKYTRGVVAMAKTEVEDAGTSGSQFFIVNAPSVDLPPDYAVIGKVSAGRDVVRRIGNVPIDPTTERPLEPVIVKSIKITDKDRE